MMGINKWLHLMWNSEMSSVFPDWWRALHLARPPHNNHDSHWSHTFYSPSATTTRSRCIYVQQAGGAGETLGLGWDKQVFLLLPIDWELERIIIKKKGWVLDVEGEGKPPSHLLIVGITDSMGFSINYCTRSWITRNKSWPKPTSNTCHAL